MSITIIDKLKRKDGDELPVVDVENVDGLPTLLEEKADLVAGTVPREQLPLIELAATRVTYSELQDRAGSYALTAGNWYLITDWELTHIIPNTNDLHTASVEPILVLATEVFALAPVAYSTVYREDILYYTIDNTDPRLPGASKGVVYRRIDTKRSNDLEIDFRNVVFRRWLDAATGYYTSCTDNGAAYQDEGIFSGYRGNIIFGNTWGGYDPRRSIFNFLNVVAGNIGKFRTNVLVNTSLLNVTLIEGGYVQGLNGTNSTINGLLIKRVAFVVLFGGTLINSVVANRYQDNNQSGWVLINSNISSEAIGSTTYLINNKQVAYAS